MRADPYREQTFDIWMDGNEHTIRRGSHYTNTTESMRCILYLEARRRGMHCVMQRRNKNSPADVITFTAEKIEKSLKYSPALPDR
jgi:hypothetical protein